MCREFPSETSITCKKEGKIYVKRWILRSITLSRYNTVRTLTMIDPWGTLVALGAKRIEIRSWSTPHHGPLAIHVAKTLPPAAKEAA